VVGVVAGVEVGVETQRDVERFLDFFAFEWSFGVTGFGFTDVVVVDFGTIVVDVVDGGAGKVVAVVVGVVGLAGVTVEPAEPNTAITLGSTPFACKAFTTSAVVCPLLAAADATAAWSFFTVAASSFAAPPGDSTLSNIKGFNPCA